jgi:hypothetical protein
VGAAQSQDQKAATDTMAPTDDELNKHPAVRPMLVKYTGRVTVILPPR